MGQRTHIINQPGGIRESVATHRLLATRPLRERVFGTLGPFSWYLMETRLSTLGVTAAGEIDIIAGLLAPVEPNPYEELYQKAARQHAGQPPNFIDWIATKDLVDQGGIAWPPRTDVLVAIEVKCAYERDGKIRSSKNSPEKIRGLHKQLYRDLSFGFDFVGLLDIIANAPGTGDGSEAWWNATRRSLSSLKLSSDFLVDRLPESDTVIGHWAWSVGSVEGGEETRRGAGAPVLLRKPGRNNPTSQRPYIEQRLSNVLGQLPRPRTWPVLVKDCYKCRRVHYFDEFSESPDNCLPG